MASDIKMMVNIEMLGMWNASDIKIIINIKMFGILRKEDIYEEKAGNVAGCASYFLHDCGSFCRCRKDTAG